MRKIAALFRRASRHDYLTVFDPQYYLEKNPDVLASGRAPLDHYLTHGWREGRDPSASFSTCAYLDKYPQLRGGRLDPLTHFIESGAQHFSSENRSVEWDEEEFRPYFDSLFYRQQYKDIANSTLDPFFHYMTYGWKEHRNPSALFDTAHYLMTYPDIRESGMNPLYHYVKHGQFEERRPLPFKERIKHKHVDYKVSVIVPNFNHGRFLTERLNSILNQTYNNLELIVLDDCSTDDSRDVIEAFRAANPDSVRAIFNDTNSGSVFAQWRRGLQAATGNLIWICESDDFCEPTFLENAIQGFADDSVMLSFGRIQFADQRGILLEGLDQYREQAMPDRWNAPFAMPSAEWFRTSFGSTNVIPNVGGCVFRRQSISDEEWLEATSYKILGDWYLYLILARGGKIFYTPSAVAYFRQHGANTSVKSFLSDRYYVEHERVAKKIREFWGGSDANVLHLYKRCEDQFRYSLGAKASFSLPEVFNVSEVLGVRRRKIHILMGVLGFDLGGGELFPVYLANELVNRGFIVSFLAMRTEHHGPNVRDELDGRVSVYDMHDVIERGVDDFLEEAGVDIIHSHYIGLEYNVLFRSQQRHPYVVTLHGSYETSPISDGDLMRMIRGVDRWVYLTAKNLKHLSGIPISKDALRHIRNGVPEPISEVRVTRQDLDVPDGAILFAVASRAIEEKGWRQTISAIEIAQQSTGMPLYLALCGTGPVYDSLLNEEIPDGVRLLGYRNDIRDIYDISDVVVLATRFPGESFPLTLIQGMQAGKPIIATSLGEIEPMLSAGEDKAGIILPNLEDDTQFIDQIARAMISMTDVDFRSKCASVSAEIGKGYSIHHVASEYEALYLNVLSETSPDIQNWQAVTEDNFVVDSV